jgi:hypothetical protein
VVCQGVCLEGSVAGGLTGVNNPWAWNPECTAVWQAWIETPWGLLDIQPLVVWLSLVGGSHWRADDEPVGVES